MPDFAGYIIPTLWKVISVSPLNRF